MKINVDYPGGNVLVLQTAENEFRLAPDMRDSDNWFYWNFRLDGAGGRTVTFRFDAEAVGYWGPGVSDDGLHWEYRPDRGEHDFRSFTYTFRPDENRVWFAMSLPYQLEHFERFYKKLTLRYPDVWTRKTLDVTPKGRSVPLLVSDVGAAKDIVLTCRHHCCESVASYVLEGVLEYVSQRRDDFAHYNFHVLPFVDLDGVEDGDQGKSRRPHDHNRDYIDEPIYSVTRKWMAYIKTLRPVADLDFHNPWLYSGNNDFSAIVMRPERVESCERFSRMFARTTARRPNGLQHTAEHDAYPDVDWNVGMKTSACAYGVILGAEYSFTLETPYFFKDKPLTTAALHDYGHDFAFTMSAIV